MSDAFKDVSTVPTLTLEPFQAEEEKKPAVQPEEPKLPVRCLTLNNTVANLAERLANTEGLSLIHI